MINRAELKNSTLHHAGSVTASLATLVASIVLARFMNLDEFGQLQIVLTFFMIVSQIELLVHPTITKIDTANQVDSLSTHVSTSAVLNATAGVAICFLCGVIYLFSNDVIYLWLGLAGLALSVKCFGPVQYALEAKNHLAISVNVVTSASLFYNFMRSAAAAVAPVISFQIAALFANNLYYTFGLYRSLKNLSIQIKWADLKSNFDWSLINRSAPYALGGFLTLLVLKIDVFLLAALSQSSQVSFYTNSVRLTEPFAFVAAGILAAVTPRLLFKFKDNYTAYRSDFRKIFWGILVVGGAIGLALFFSSRILIESVYGEKYIQAVSILHIHSFTVPFVLLMPFISFWDIQHNDRFAVYVRMGGGLFINVTLNIFLIPHYGAIGSSISSVISYSFIVFWSSFFFDRGRSFLKSLF